MHRKGDSNLRPVARLEACPTGPTRGRLGDWAMFLAFTGLFSRRLSKNDARGRAGVTFHVKGRKTTRQHDVTQRGVNNAG